MSAKGGKIGRESGATLQQMTENCFDEEIEIIVLICLYMYFIIYIYI